jgi:two-component sensor histidine kinase
MKHSPISLMLTYILPETSIGWPQAEHFQATGMLRSFCTAETTGCLHMDLLELGTSYEKIPRFLSAFACLCTPLALLWHLTHAARQQGSRLRAEKETLSGASIEPAGCVNTGEMPDSDVREWLARTIYHYVPRKRRFIVAAAALAGIVGVFMHAVLRWVFEVALSSHRVETSVDYIITGVFAFLLALALLAVIRAKREAQLRRLLMIAELNHHIRNSLQVIIYQSALSGDGATAAKRINDAVAEIERALEDTGDR